MPKAEVGSTKWLGNKMKSKGLQRLRWYCQPCEKQCRDENGFKQHTLSESHVRTMLLVGEDSKKAIRNFSNQFKHDFIQLLRTAHNEKPVHANQFYQTYIAHKEHVHMNSTDWPSLTEFVKYLGREGIVRVSETEKGLFIQWVDDSPEALRRRDAVRKKERQDKGDEEREQRLIREQIERANEKARELEAERPIEEPKLIERKEGEKITLNLFGKKPETLTVKAAPDSVKAESRNSPTPTTAPSETKSEPAVPNTTLPEPTAAPVKLSFSAAPIKPKNVFASGKKNPLANKKTSAFEQPKKVSEAERIMKEELERKRKHEESGGRGKKMRFN